MSHPSSQAELGHIHLGLGWAGVGGGAGREARLCVYACVVEGTTARSQTICLGFFSGNTENLRAPRGRYLPVRFSLQLWLRQANLAAEQLRPPPFLNQPWEKQGPPSTGSSEHRPPVPTTPGLPHFHVAQGCQFRNPLMLADTALSTAQEREGAADRQPRAAGARGRGLALLQSSPLAWVHNGAGAL